MYSSAFYKMEAKRKLKGVYYPAIVGALICMIPTYLLFLADFAFEGSSDLTVGIGNILTPIVTIFITNIIFVGFLRFLMNLDPSGEPRYRFNDVLSGYTCSFRNTLKTMFLRDMYLLGWGLLAAVPSVVVIGVIAFMAITSNTISQLYSMLSQLFLSPSYDMMVTVSEYVEQNCIFIPIITFIAFFATVALIVPLICKTYEYKAVPMILAQYPDMNSREVFARTKDIMTGYKWRYFTLQLSFVLWLFLVVIVSSLFGGLIPAYFLALAVLYPYMYKTLLEFYTQRTETVEYNISVYGNDETFDNLGSEGGQTNEN